MDFGLFMCAWQRGDGGSRSIMGGVEMNMRNRLFCVFVTILPALALGQTVFPKQGIALKANVTLASMPSAPTSGAGCASYVSPSGQEYACMGVRTGTVIYRITNPTAPVLIAHIPGLVSTWHEMAVCGEYLYSVADSVNQGMQIIDLRQVDQGIATLVSTYHGPNNLNKVHTIQANPASKTLYLNGSNLGMLMLDITNPTAPIEVGRWTTKYVHDCYVRSFTSGPYAGKEIAFFCCAGSGLYIVDVTNKAAMVNMSNVPYFPPPPAPGYYSHSGSLTADGRYFLINDEFDEINNLTSDTTTHVVEVSDLLNPVWRGAFVNPIGVIDHNSQMVGNYLFLAAYRAGLRIYDATNPLAMSEVGFFDTYPSGAGESFDGAWGTAVGYPSGNVIISDINRGLFVVDPSEALGLGAPLESEVVTAGQWISGGVAELKKQDGQELIIRAGVDSKTGSRPVARFEVTAFTTVTPSNFIDLKFVGNPTAAVRVELRNWSTGQFEQVGILNISNANPVAALNGIPGGNFVNSTAQSLGQIEARFMAIPPTNGSRGDLVMHFDQVKFTVRR